MEQFAVCSALADQLREVMSALGVEGRTTADPGQWYSVENVDLFMGVDETADDLFATKDGSHPCIVRREWDGTYGDVCHVYPRSTTGGVGIEHALHYDHRGSECALTKNAHVVVDVPCIVGPAGMAVARNSCDEPRPSVLDQCIEWGP